jgi:hypothetical protein
MIYSMTELFRKIKAFFHRHDFCYIKTVKGEGHHRMYYIVCKCGKHYEG